MKPIISLLVWLCLLFNSNVFSQTDPNIILIIADDMGWSQVSTGLTNLNNPSDFFETPNIETLASEGIAFPYGYVNGANCAPTRAALLSGQYPARPTNNIFAVDNLNRGGNSTLLVGPDNGLPNGIDELPNDPLTNDAITLAETMKLAGYSTVHLGKYHVGENEDTDVSDNAATDQGFDTNFGGGTKGNPGDYFASSGMPYTFGGSIGPELDAYAEVYLNDDLTDSDYLLDGNSLIGTPKHVTDAMVEAATDWIDTNSNNPFFMHFSNYAVHGPFNPSDARPDLRAKYNDKAINNPGLMGHDFKPGQAALGEGMDQAIGRLINHLKTTSDPRNPGKMLSENTLVYFISDNGGAVRTEDNGPLRGYKGDLYEGGIRSVTFAWSEAPWLANKGTVNTTPIIAFDLYPTFVEAAGGSLPGGGYEIDGESQWQMLINGTAMTRDALYWHFPGYIRSQTPVTVIRKGDYKLIHFYETADYEMYDLINDISETTNLLDGNPDQATIDLANDMVTDMRTHLIDTSAPLPTYRSGANAGDEVPLPALISNTPSNSTDGCQAESGYNAYWDFDIASNADDASVNLNNPIATTGTLSYDAVDFKEGDQSVVFNGSTRIQYNDGTFLNASTASRSVSVWIKPTNLTGTQEILDEGGNGNGLAIRLNNATLEAQITNNTDPDENVSAIFPNDGDWHHIALVFDGANTSLKLYIDGVEEDVNSSAFSILDTHSSPGGIGGVMSNDAFNSGETGTYFTGKMDAFAVYDSVLTESQVQNSACYIPPPSSGCVTVAKSSFEAFWDFDNGNNADDVSGNNHDPQIAISSGITFDSNDFKDGDQSIAFNGTEAIQYATNSGTPDNFLNTSTSSRSIAVWIKPTNLTGNQNIFDEGGNNKGIAVRLSGGNLESVIRDTNSTASLISASFPNDGAWHHVAMVYDGSTTNHTLYIDGSQVANDNSANVPGTVPSNLSYGGIAGKLSGKDSFQNTLDAFFTGKMDAFALSNGVLSGDQINSLITSWYLGVDNDNDGFFSNQTITNQCTNPGGYSATALTIDDCDDTDDTIHPNTVWYIGVDADND
ncbi:LamG-like jellyroll fold domain-containing protein, partial [Flaviramulus aquimarinus]|uniref:LamG-like jellyroll fold domain-containing protein n=1 Tax=Flaviramulus aquimarinus TaxID=1170456 RepID=UPI0031EEF2E0